MTETGHPFCVADTVSCHDRTPSASVASHPLTVYESPLLISVTEPFSVGGQHGLVLGSATVEHDGVAPQLVRLSRCRPPV